MPGYWISCYKIGAGVHLAKEMFEISSIEGWGSNEKKYDYVNSKGGQNVSLNILT